ncbi:MAG: DUF559 domain-containing protein [Cycloclasticus sp.]|nr:DUF559 domain-containing protein [Cycloclasticus sp.]
MIVKSRNTKNYLSLPYNPKLKQRARELRKAGNLSEVLFWNQVKRKQFLGLDFDRQKIIGNYIVDFYCANVQTVIEIDGSSHDDKQEYDAKRDAYLEGLGLTVIHILDADVKNNLEGVISWLHQHEAFVLINSPPLEGCPKGGVVSSLQGGVVEHIEKNHPDRFAPTPPEEGNWESASELLARIQAEKAQLIEDKKIKKQKPLPPISEEEKPFELPDGWVWTRIESITNVVTSGSRNWKSLYSESGASFIRSQDIKLDRLCYANRAYVNVSNAKEGKRTLVNQHDWLIIITGANVGKCAYIYDDLGEAYVSQHVGLMRPTIKEMGEFGHLWLIAELGGRGLLASFIYGDKPGLNLLQLRSLLIPLPPLPEQKAIVTKVEKLLTLCDQLETQITDNQSHAEQLMQAVLKEAFAQP